MKTKEIEIAGQKIVLNELGYFDIVELGNLGKREWAMKIFELSGMKKEDIANKELMTTENGGKIMNVINELNGWVDFQKTSKSEKE